MGSEEFRISLSGPTVAFFLYQTVNRPTDFEGLLFGDYRRILHREVTDREDAGDRNRPCTVIHDIYIRRVVPTGARFSFYDRQYEAKLPEYVADVVNDISGNSTNSGPLYRSPSSHSPGRSEGAVRSGFFGWFRYQTSPPADAYSEQMICRALSSVDALRRLPALNGNVSTPCMVNDLSSYYPWPGHGPIYVFSHPGSKDNILEWDMQLKAFHSGTGQFRPLRMQIRNLGDTTHADYWKMGDSGAAAFSSVDHLFPGLIPRDTATMLVESTNGMAESAKIRLKGACDKVLDETQKALENWKTIREQSPVELSLEYCLKYGYCPKVDQIEAALDHFHSVVGSKRVDDVSLMEPSVSVPSIIEELMKLTDPVPVADDGTTAQSSQKSEDLFDVPKQCHVPRVTNEQQDEDTTVEGWERLPDTRQLNEELNDTTPPPLAERIMMLQVDDFDSSFRGSKRPKEATSSSSSGANSDELTEHTSTAKPPTGRQRSKSPYGASLSQSNVTTRKQAATQRKKSKGFDGSAAMPAAMTPTVSGVSLSQPTLQRPSLSQSSSVSASPVQVPDGPIGIGKGRGRRDTTVPPPPGFTPKQ